MMVPRSYMHSQVVREAAATKKPKSRKSSPMNSKNTSPRNSLSAPLSGEKLPTIQVLKEKQRSASEPDVKRKERQKQLAESGPAQQQPSKNSSSDSLRKTTPPKSSAPVVIPVRKPLAGESRRTVNGRMTPRSVSSRNGNETAAIPPAVAALLAGTSIPPPKGRHLPRARTSNSLPRHVSMEHLQQEWRKDSSVSSSLGRGSPLEFLLEPAEDGDEIESGDDMDKEPSSLPSRSISSDSIYSATPSLNTDEELMMSSPPYSSPTTPTSFRRPSRLDRKEKMAIVSSPPSIECHDHPLLHSTIPEDIELPSPTDSSPTPISKRTSNGNKQQPKSLSSSSIKSNLTASFQAIKSAARAFSNFTAPSLPSDDFLTRSLFSSKYASEMRPRHFAGDVPDASLRRYLNPAPPAVHSSAVMTDFHALLTDSMWREAGSGGSSNSSLKSSASTESLPRASSSPGKKASTGTAGSPMIQLQTYVRVGRSPSPSLRQSRRNSSTSSPLPPLPPPERAEFPIAAVGPDGALAIVRQREPRENSDFLRVIVLEMNMRRVGKLDGKAAGRARVWLPPRKMSVVIESVGGNAVLNPGVGVVQVAAPGLEAKERKTPERWVGVGVDDV